MPYTAQDVLSRSRILRLLLGGPAKAGKTTASILTSPQPVFVFNSDGKGALDPVVSMGGEFTAEDVTSTDSFDKAFTYLKSHLNDFETVVFDNITSFSAYVESEVRAKIGRDDPRVIYPEYTRQLMERVHKLLDLPRHLIIIGHLDAGDNDVPGSFGHMLGVSGQAKTKISMIMQDWVWLHVNMEGGVAKRQFLLAPEGNWTKAVRSIQNIPRMEANVTKFIELMERGAPKKPIAVVRKTNG